MNEQYNYDNQQQNYSPAPNMPPARQLKTNRHIVIFLLLSFITFGIYSIVFYTSVANDLNTIASRYDGKKTMHYCLLCFIVAPLTLGIGAIVWFHKISARMGNELRRRGIAFDFGAADFWLWNVLGSLIIVGPFIYMYKFIKAINLLAANYNVNG